MLSTIGSGIFSASHELGETAPRKEDTFLLIRTIKAKKKTVTNVLLVLNSFLAVSINYTI